MNKSLIDLQKEFNIKTDKQSAHTYLEQYDKLFKRFRYKKINILEIGVLRGESLKLWSKYFLNSKIYGIDLFNRPACQTHGPCDMESVKKNISNFNNIHLFNVDSCEISKDALDSRINFFNHIGDTLFHIIIDDGNHHCQEQIETFRNFKNVLHKDGMYIIEDIHERMCDNNFSYFFQPDPNSNTIAAIQEAIPGIRINMDLRKQNNTLGIYEIRE